MALPYFYTPVLNDNLITLDEETSKHAVQVLRMVKGDRLLITDGAGQLAEAEINDANKKKCTISIITADHKQRTHNQLTIAISIIKNANRFEWFLEKATELGTAEIVPLICERTESEKFRADRYTGICRSAMLQSMQRWLPALHEPQLFDDIIRTSVHHQRFIAHCAEDDKQSFATSYDRTLQKHIILIGPEGDFTAREIQTAKNNGFLPVSLGATRLRTETAGVFAAVVANII